MVRAERNGTFLKQESRSPRSKSKPLFVKGNNIAKVEEGKGDSKRKESRPVSASKKGKGEKKKPKMEDK